MNRFLAGTCALVFAMVAVGSAKAQANFQGFYVGANGGGAFGRFNAQTSTNFSPTGYFASTSVFAIGKVGNQNIEPSGFSAGGGGGYNHQWGSFVVGLEGDFETLNLSGSSTGTATYPCCAPTGFTVTQTAKTSWMFTIRPRVGWVFGHVMIYETVGAAFTNVKYTGLFTDTFATAHENASLQETRPGYAAGAGAEVSITRHVSIKGEYLYAGFGTATVPSANLTAFTPPIPFPSNVFNHSVNLHAHIARAGVNFRF